jgi:hypothetical protein
VRWIALVAVAAAFVTRGAAASPIDDERIRHGAGIGSVRLGMTYAEVRQILGGPQTVDKRERLSGGRRYLELSWDFGWWTVGFMGKPNRMRVVSVQTVNRRERTAEGLGVGSLERAVRSTLRVRCLTVLHRSLPYNRSIESRCAYESHRGRETAFVLGLTPGEPYAWRLDRYEVIAVRVHEKRGDYCFRGRYVCRPR